MVGVPHRFIGHAQYFVEHAMYLGCTLLIMCGRGVVPLGVCDLT